MLASRASGRGAHLVAFCHGLATALIGFPLVWEATYRFGVLSPGQSALLLAVLTAVALVLSAVRELQSLAWIVVLGALAAAFTLAVATAAWFEYTVLAIAIGLASLWLGYTREWILLRWPAAVAGHLMLVVLTGRAAAGGGARAALLAQAVMLIAYLGSFALRTLVRNRTVVPFEVVQSVGVLASAFGGALFLIHAQGASVLPVAVASLVLGTAVYVVAFSFVAHRRHEKNVLFYSLLGLVLTATGIALIGGTSVAAIVYGSCALAAAVAASRRPQPVLVLHGVIYATAAAIVSGLALAATIAIARPPAEWLSMGPLAIPSLAVATIVAALPFRAVADAWQYLARVPRAFLFWLLAWMYVGVTSAAGVQLLARAGEELTLLPTVRTIVLVAVALAAAWIGRGEQWRETGWLTYPLLVLTGLKILFVDFPQGRPSTLFLALACYGVALIVAPRLARRAASDAARSSVTFQGV